MCLDLLIHVNKYVLTEVSLIISILHKIWQRQFVVSSDILVNSCLPLQNYYFTVLGQEQQYKNWMPEQKLKEGVVVEMHQSYPFGQLKEVSSDEEVLVRKKLVYQNMGQLQILKKMVQFLHTLQNQHLIELKHYQLMGQDKFYFFYQYVPLTLEKWILDLGDDILEDLQFQMLSLASYLVQQNIKFHFDPKCLGLSKQIKVKYFLQEFMIDSDQKMNNYKEVEEEIVKFFNTFRLNYTKNQETSTDFSDRKSADSALLLNRIEQINSRDSWDSGHRSLATNRSKKNLMLSQKIQNSKRKSMQILMKLKHMKPHSTE